MHNENSIHCTRLNAIFDDLDPFSQSRVDLGMIIVVIFECESCALSLLARSSSSSSSMNFIVIIIISTGVVLL